MPYYGYYGGYGDFLANNIYCILLIPVLLLSLWAQAQVSGNFKRYSGVANRRRLTGAQAAEAVLRAHGVYNVAIRPCSGSLTDHYDPRDNSISLSENVYNLSLIHISSGLPWTSFWNTPNMWATSTAPPSGLSLIHI